MLIEELESLVHSICTQQSDPQTVACLVASDTPLDLYDLLSAFANQDEGGTVVFGVDEENGCELCGVSGVLDLQQSVLDQCAQMEPEIQPLFTVARIDGVRIVSAEIPATDASLRPCYYLGKGGEQGAFKRTGDHVELLSPYELYSFTADAERIHDDGRVMVDCAPDAIDPSLAQAYRDRLRADRPSLGQLSDSQLMTLTGLERDGFPTLAELLLFGRYPQAALPQLCIDATRVAEEEDDDGMVIETALQTARLDGTVPEMVEKAVTFALGNPDAAAGAAEGDAAEQVEGADDAQEASVDQIAIPAAALREAVLNALMHRDYSSYTESIPVQMVVHADRVEIVSPGGLFGTTRIEQLGSAWCDVRNTALAGALAVQGVTAGNQSGLTTMAATMDEAGCPEPEIWCNRSTFSVTLYAGTPVAPAYDVSDDTQKLLAFCTVPRSRAEIAELFGLSSVAYVTNHYIMPAVEKGLLSMSLPQKPRSKNQRYTTVS